MDYPTINVLHYLCGTLASKEQKVKSLIVYTCTSRKLELFVAIAKLGEGNGTPLQYSCLENPMDGGAW